MRLTPVPFVERTSTFACGSDSSVAISASPSHCFKRGVLVIVGGPQYRAGSHRQFALLCRMLAGRGIAAMRFDYRGMGDSEGQARSFEDVDDDLRAATDHFLAQHPQLEEVVLWGLCDAASAALFYAQHDPRISGLVLLNPWVRTPEGVAQAYVKGYYGKRIFAPDFWGKVLGGRFNIVESGRNLVSNVIAATRTQSALTTASERPGTLGQALPQRMLQGWREFRGRILLILSSNDLTADEFRGLVARDDEWHSAVAEARVALHEVPEANHTFARADWRAHVEQLTADWVRSW